jgi:hypothetical protein
MSDVHAAAAALLHRVADGGEIPIDVLHGFAEFVLRSELVAGSRQVLDASPELAARLRALSWLSGRELTSKKKGKTPSESRRSKEAEV